MTSKASKSFPGVVAAAVLLWNILDIPNLLDAFDEEVCDELIDLLEERLVELANTLGFDPTVGAAGASRNDTLTGLGPSICTICASDMSLVILWPLMATIS